VSELENGGTMAVGDVLSAEIMELDGMKKTSWHYLVDLLNLQRLPGSYTLITIYLV